MGTKAQKGKLVDIFTGNVMDISKQNKEKNDHAANNAGSNYLGVIPKSTASYILDRGHQLQGRFEQLQNLYEQLEAEHAHHNTRVLAVLENLGIATANIPGHNLVIDKDGHVFLVNEPGLLN